MWTALGRVRWTQRARFSVALAKGSVMCYEPSWILSRMPSPALGWAGCISCDTGFHSSRKTFGGRHAQH